MTAPRKLAYAGQRGHVYSEKSWIDARRWLQGETEDQAKQAIEREIGAGKIVVVTEEMV